MQVYLLSRETTKKMIQSDMLKNTTNKSRWNTKNNVQITQKNVKKENGNRKQSKQEIKYDRLTYQ